MTVATSRSRRTLTLKHKQTNTIRNVDRKPMFAKIRLALRQQHSMQHQGKDIGTQKNGILAMSFP